MRMCTKCVNLIAIPMALALVSCESDSNTSGVNSRISKENFEKLSQGMPLQEVDSILGAENALRYAEGSNSGLGSVLENQCVGKRWIRCRIV